MMQHAGGVTDASRSWMSDSDAPSMYAVNAKKPVMKVGAKTSWSKPTRASRPKRSKG